MASQHVSLYLWGTSSPIYSRLKSTHRQWYPASDSKMDALPSTNTDIGAGYSVGTDIKEYTSIECGKGSYLEQVSSSCCHTCTTSERSTIWSRCAL